MIRKLFAGASVLAIAAVAVMLVGIGSSSKTADAHVSAIVGPSTIDNSFAEFEVRIIAEDGDGDVFIGASDGHFSWDGSDCEYADQITDCDVTLDSGGAGDIAQFLIVNDDCGGCDVSSIYIDYTPPQGFSGGSIDIFACQEDQDDIYDDFPNVDCPNGIRKTIQVIGAVSSVTLYALRDYSNDGDIDLCTGSKVYVIAGLQYTDNVWHTSDFDNTEAIICAEVRDSANHPVDNANVFFSDSGPGCITGPNPNNTNGDGVAHTRFAHCDTGDAGETSTVTGCVASVCGSVTVEFGGDPVECEIVVNPHDLDIGDVGTIHVQWWAANGHKVPDGITSYFSMAHSGESSSNAVIVDSPENTVNSMAEGSAITGFAGESTVAAHAVASDRPDVVCGEHLSFTGDHHQHPDECIVDGEEDPDFVLYGNIPPGGNFEWGTFAFCGGSFATLVEISECDPDTAIFWYNTPAGGWESYVPGADVAAVNAAIMARFPDEHAGIPRGTIFTAACSAIEEA